MAFFSLMSALPHALPLGAPHHFFPLSSHHKPLPCPSCRPRLVFDTLLSLRLEVCTIVVPHRPPCPAVHHHLHSLSRHPSPFCVPTHLTRRFYHRGKRVILPSVLWPA